MNKSNPMARLTTLIDNLASGVSDPPDRFPEVILQDADLGAVFLWDEHAATYRECVRTAHALVRDPELMSGTTVSTLLKRVVLESLDPAGKSGDVPFEQRRDRALATLRNELMAEPVRWEIYVPVVGVTTADAFMFGKVEFLRASAEQVEGLQSRANLVIQSGADTPENKAGMEKHLRDWLDRFVANRVVGRIRVSAVDKDAAEARAAKEVRLTLDAINFFADVLHSQGMRVCARMPGDLNSELAATLIYQQDATSFAFHGEHFGPLEDFGSGPRRLDHFQGPNLCA